MARPTYNGTQMNGAGFVYLFRLDRFHKIGSSKNPARRLSQFGNLPWIPVLVHTIASERRGFVERLLQHRFRPQRVRGEWFRLTEADVQTLCAVTRLDSVSDFPSNLLPHPRFWREPRDDQGQGLSAKIDASLAEALFDYMRSTAARATVDQVVAEAMKQMLTVRGFWPRPKE